jgi:hypothetical protein
LGDEWELSPGLVLRICDAGGAALFDPDDQESLVLSAWLKGIASGELFARCDRYADDDGADLAYLTLRGRIRIETLDELVHGSVPGGLGYVEGEMHVGRSAELEIEGEARWDLTADSLVDLVLEAEVGMELECEMVGEGDVLAASSVRARLEGSLRAEVSLRPGR